MKRRLMGSNVSNDADFDFFRGLMKGSEIGGHSLIKVK